MFTEVKCWPKTVCCQMQPGKLWPSTSWLNLACIQVFCASVHTAWWAVCASPVIASLKWKINFALKHALSPRKLWAWWVSVVCFKISGRKERSLKNFKLSTVSQTNGSRSRVQPTGENNLFVMHLVLNQQAHGCKCSNQSSEIGDLDGFQHDLNMI